MELAGIRFGEHSFLAFSFVLLYYSNWKSLDKRLFSEHGSDDHPLEVGATITVARMMIRGFDSEHWSAGGAVYVAPVISTFVNSAPDHDTIPSAGVLRISQIVLFDVISMFRVVPRPERSEPFDWAV